MTTRYQQQPSLHVYEETNAGSYDQAPMPPGSPKKSGNRPLAAMKNAQPKNPNYGAQTNGMPPIPPIHAVQFFQNPPSTHHFDPKLNGVPMAPPSARGSQMDSMEKKYPQMSNFRTASAGPQKALFNTFSSAKVGGGKENMQQRAPAYPVVSQYPDGYPPPNPAGISPLASNASPKSVNSYGQPSMYGQKTPGKRTLLEAAPISDSRPAKKVKENDEDEDSDTITVIRPDEVHVPQDDGQKPPHSYANLIGMAILTAPNRRLTLAQIYKWISDHFSFYKPEDAGWQNSIRHNLSLNKAFHKQERPKDDPGKGNYWVIEEGKEDQFSAKAARKSTNETSRPNSGVGNGPSSSNRPSSRSGMGTPAPELPPFTAPMPQDSHVPAGNRGDPSSDATIPESDVVQAEDAADVDSRAANTTRIPSSPPTPIQMPSSPPVQSRTQGKAGTSLPAAQFNGSPRSRTHKRKISLVDGIPCGSIDDSGYISNFGSSSANRPRKAARIEADRPRIKRGRAEEEIARLRNSSSPSKPRRINTNSAILSGPVSSSPVRDSARRASKMLPPITPAVKLAPKQGTPASVSQESNLEKHRNKVRELIGSPERGVVAMNEAVPYSPAFNLDAESFFMTNFNTPFNSSGEIRYGESPVDMMAHLSDGSPSKKSVARPCRTTYTFAYENLHTPGRVLKNFDEMIAETRFSPTTANDMPPDYWKTPPARTFAASPTKQFLRTPALANDDFSGNEFLAEDISDSPPGMDILQGFDKIGSNRQVSRDTASGHNTTARPPMGRSFTSRF